MDKGCILSLKVPVYILFDLSDPALHLGQAMFISGSCPFRGHPLWGLSWKLSCARSSRKSEVKEPYQNLMTDLEQLKAVEIAVDGQVYLARTELLEKAYDVFKSVDLRPPAKVLEVMPSARCDS